MRTKRLIVGRTVECQINVTDVGNRVLKQDKNQLHTLSYFWYSPRFQHSASPS
jgi:hypothetical protein